MRHTATRCSHKYALICLSLPSSTNLKNLHSTRHNSIISTRTLSSVLPFILFRTSRPHHNCRHTISTKSHSNRHTWESLNRHRSSKCILHTTVTQSLIPYFRSKNANRLEVCRNHSWPLGRCRCRKRQGKDIKYSKMIASLPSYYSSISSVSPKSLVSLEAKR